MFFTAICVLLHITLNIICVMSVRDWMKIKQFFFQLTCICLPCGSIKGSAVQKTFCLCLISYPVLPRPREREISVFSVRQSEIWVQD